MKETKLDLSIILPAFNEESVIGLVTKDIQSVLQENQLRTFEILVVDDGSDDNTADIAQKAGARVVRHPNNIGNGAAIKTGIRESRGKVLVMLDADGQHSPQDIPRFLEEIGRYDMVVGARIQSSDTAMHRDIGNKIYNTLASYVSDRRIEDLTSGFRAIKRDIAFKFIYLLPNTFSYPTTITLAVLRSGGSLLYIPIETKRRVGISKINLLQDSLRFLIIILRISSYYSPLKIFLPMSALMFLTGFGYGLYKVLFLNARYGPTSAMIMTVSVVVFMVGLVSEQIAQLRYLWSEINNKENESE